MELICMNDFKVRRDCTALIQKCDNYLHYHPKAKLWIRDTDHKYCPIRLESENVPPEDYKVLISTCPKCGSNLLGKKANSNDHYEDYDLEFCDYCLAVSEKTGRKKLLRLLQYTGRIDSSDNYNNSKCEFVEPNNCTIQNITLALKEKLRVWTKDQKLLYLILDRIRMNQNGNLYIEHLNDKTDIVKFAGFYLDRDRYGQRIYQGDVVKCIYRKRLECIGILTEKHPLPNTGKYSFLIEQNPFSFPLSSQDIDYSTIEVIGNIFENPELMGDVSKHYIWYIGEITDNS